MFLLLILFLFDLLLSNDGTYDSDDHDDSDDSDDDVKVKVYYFALNKKVL